MMNDNSDPHPPFWRALSLRGSEGGGKKRKSDEATEHFCGEVDFPAQ